MTAAEPKRYAQIHGCEESCFNKVLETISRCIAIKQRTKIGVTLGLQMVLMPAFADQILPLARLGKELGVDYLVLHPGSARGSSSWTGRQSLHS